MKNDKKVTTKDATKVDLDLDSEAYKNPLSETAKSLAKSVTSDNTLSKFISSAKQDNEQLLKSFELLKPSPAIVELGKSIRLQEERMANLLKGIGISDITKQASKVFESINKEYYIPQMPRIDHDEIYKNTLKASDGITSEFYEEKDKEYKRLLDDVSAKIKASEQVDNTFYVTAKYILELAKNSGKLFEKAEKEERQILINTVLTNIRYDGKNLSYDYIEPFNLLADFSKRKNGVEDGT